MSSLQSIALVASCGAVAAVGAGFVAKMASSPESDTAGPLALMAFLYDGHMMNLAVLGAVAGGAGFALADMVKGPALGIGL